MTMPENTASRTRSQAGALFKVFNNQSQLENRLTFSMLSRYLTYRLPIELLFHQLYTKEQFWVDTGLAKRQAAANCLERLEEIGVSAPTKLGRRTSILKQGFMRSFQNKVSRSAT